MKPYVTERQNQKEFMNVSLQTSSTKSHCKYAHVWRGGMSFTQNHLARTKGAALARRKAVSSNLFTILSGNYFLWFIHQAGAHFPNSLKVLCRKKKVLCRVSVTNQEQECLDRCDRTLICYYVGPRVSPSCITDHGCGLSFSKSQFPHCKITKLFHSAAVSFQSDNTHKSALYTVKHNLVFIP